jgi:glycosyltransferase involved in cell wall biosynthesis
LTNAYYAGGEDVRDSMRILYAVPGYKPAYRIGGPILSVSAAAEALVRRGHDVTVFTTNSNLDEDLDVPTDRAVDVDGVRVWYFRRVEPLKRWLSFIPYLSKSMGILYAPDMGGALDRVVPVVDLVHTHLPFIYPTYMASRAALRYRKPLFYHQRGVFDPERLKFRGFKKHMYIKAVERPILRSATTLFALTEAEVHSYRALGVNTPCRVIPNGIDVSQYRQEPSQEWHTEWDIPADALLVLFMSRIHPIKGADKLLEAFIQIHTRFPRALLVMAGPDEWGLENKYRQIVQREGLDRRVVFPGMVSGPEKLDLLARADLFCLPSVAEGFSMAVLESLASATPVLLSPGCHFPEIEAAGAGRIVDNTPESIADALAALLAEPTRLCEMGRLGRKFVAEKYKWGRIADELVDAYRDGLLRSKI